MPAENGALSLSKGAEHAFDKLGCVRHPTLREVLAPCIACMPRSASPSGYGPSTGSGREGDQRRRRRAVPKMLRTISVPALRANCLKALESVICSTIDLSARCGLRDRARLVVRASRSA
jgi:hypothetical protein